MKDTGKLRWALGLFVALSFGAIGVACDDDGDDKPGVDAAVDAKPITDGPAGDAASVPFGTVCTSNTSCGGVTNFCAKFPPTAATGLCTFFGCMATPGVCPAADPCTHVNLYITSPGIPANTYACIAPAKLQAFAGDAGADGGSKDSGGDASGDAQKD